VVCLVDQRMTISKEFSVSLIILRIRKIGIARKKQIFSHTYILEFHEYYTAMYLESVIF